ncbi:DNA-3-methyladenine glycosylase [Reichenbachiella carrageenanivorans]|uniref:Putative 3-methyladenine DNA glycosylase n=1 Tax=Reichenbachiella carrageenanivorans TaxID=2979869 RepID=A0ABY6D0Y0_9BACT|nr:DNA-3-methyladenine glycosylase [Reichenbachiella carrageenanivorans]UXX78718.1 DNA-3-methyladenine glycosylase [Reichenbachiella carrageenanivorans]
MKKDSLNILPNDFYLRSNVLEIAKNLLGKTLCTAIDGAYCKGKIVEVEAYRGHDDKACHANNGKRTERTEVMYRAGGCAYVYLCYGIHHLFNVVTNIEGIADAVLIRALEPLEGMAVMKARLQSSNQKLTNGPGILAKSMGISTQLTGIALVGNHIWIENADPIDDLQIVTTTRIGVDYAEEDALLPWRFYLKDNDWVSKK